MRSPSVLTISTLLAIANLAWGSISILRSLDTAPVLHFTLARRGGSFAATEWTKDYVNLTYLTQQLEKIEDRFNLTQRVVKGNKLVRKAKIVGAKGSDEGALMGKIADDGLWYAKIKIGEPPQEVEMDLNMLTADFYVVLTTSRIGSKYDDLFSQTITKSYERPYPTCTLPTDSFHLPTINISIPLSFAYCRPSKFSLDTLGASGSALGLTPSEHLRQTKSTSILEQLLQKQIIERPVFSLMLINGQEGVLSIGGTGARAVEMVEQQTKDELDHVSAVERGELTTDFDGDNIIKRSMMEPVFDTKTNWEEGWKWSQVQGAEGWWQVLMQGVWVDGSKVLHNQAAVIDINSPFILAPPLAAKAFYASISGSRPLPAPHSNFYMFPCLNPPKLHLEFTRWNFPLLQGGRGADWTGVPGGKFSLGRLRDGSGYCVGAVVESRMGVKDEGMGAVGRGSRSGAGHGNGMRDVWVVGEGFFRGVGAVFDFKEQRVGFRSS